MEISNCVPRVPWYAFWGFSLYSWFFPAGHLSSPHLFKDFRIPISWGLTVLTIQDQAPYILYHHHHSFLDIPTDIISQRLVSRIFSSNQSFLNFLKVNTMTWEVEVGYVLFGSRQGGNSRCKGPILRPYLSCLAANVLPPSLFAPWWSFFVVQLGLGLSWTLK